MCIYVCLHFYFANVLIEKIKLNSYKLKFNVAAIVNIHTKHTHTYLYQTCICMHKQIKYVHNNYLHSFQCNWQRTNCYHFNSYAEDAAAAAASLSFLKHASKAVKICPYVLYLKSIKFLTFHKIFLNEALLSYLCILCFNNEILFFRENMLEKV